MLTQVNTTIELNPEVASLAYEMGLNASKICENALIQAINRLQGVTCEEPNIPKPLNSELTILKPPKGPVDQSGMIAAFATRKPRVQIPPGPPLTTH